MEAQGMTEAYDWENREVIGSDGEKIGKVDQVYLDEESGRPEWLSPRGSPPVRMGPEPAGPRAPSGSGWRSSWRGCVAN